MVTALPNYLTKCDEKDPPKTPGSVTNRDGAFWKSCSIPWLSLAFICKVVLLGQEITHTFIYSHQSNDFLSICHVF